MVEPDTDYAAEIISMAYRTFAGDMNEEVFEREVYSMLNELFHLGTQSGYEQGFDEGLKAWTS